VFEYTCPDAGFGQSGHREFGQDAEGAGRSVTEEAFLRDKLHKIEALFAGAATPGEKAAAGAAAERIRARLRQSERQEKLIEVRFRLPDPWSRQMFIALARRYGLRPYRNRGMHRQTILLKTPKSFVDNVLWPEFQQINAALVDYLAAVTDRVIREEVYKESTDAEEVPESAGNGR
jgi:hypothetical protein